MIYNHSAFHLGHDEIPYRISIFCLRRSSSSSKNNDFASASVLNEWWITFWNFYFFCIWKVAARRSYSLSMKSERKTCRKLWNIACTIHQYHASLAKVRMAEESLKFFQYVKVRTVVYTYTVLKTLWNVRICLLANILEFFKPPLYCSVHTWYCSRILTGVTNR